MTGAGPDDAVRRALALISEHPGVDGVVAPLTDSASGATTVDVAFRVNLPSEWRRQGESPSGVRSREVVRFDFAAGYPLFPPTLSFREDFTRNLPHMQPWVTNGRPAPCIYDGDTGELLHRDGLAGILNQTSLWLDNAALGRLIDPEQGWEPVRRDSFHDDVVADAGHLQGLVDRRGGWRLLKVSYLKIGAADGSYSIHGQVLREVVKVNPTSVGQRFREGELHGDAGFHRGFSLALIAWPGKLPSGEAIVSDNYYPETVETIDGLKERAVMYGCGDELDTGLRWLEKCLSGWPEAGPFPMPVILLARRPFHLIGSTSPIELCPYIVEIRAPGLFDDGGATVVRAAAHRHTISRPLLAAMAGRTTTSERPRWTLVGAGSLGSKLALHLARAGNGPEVVVDRSGMSPHNAARHALVPATGDMQILWMDAKARSLVQALCGLDQEATALVADAAAMAMDRKRAQSAWSKESWAVVNATASLAVREAFGASEWIRPRVVEASLFAGGRVGAITVEGPGRNPSTTDLIAEFYAMLQEEPELSSIVFDDNYRIWSTDWFEDADRELKKLMDHVASRLEAILAGSGAAGGEKVLLGETVERSDEQPVEASTSQGGPEELDDEPLFVEVGDTVLYHEMGCGQDIRRATVVRGKDDPAKAIINDNKPLAVALLGAAAGETVTVRQPTSELDVVVNRIERPERENGEAMVAGASTSVDGVELAPYKEWRGEAADPRRASRGSAAETLCAIIETEGPVLANRAYQIHVRASGIQRLGPQLRRFLDRALAKLERDGRVVVERATGERGYRNAVLRKPETDQVRMRDIGPRSFDEVPGSELAALVGAIKRSKADASSDEIYREILDIYGLVRMTAQVRKRFEEASTPP